MPNNEKKGITVKIDANLHAEIRQYLDEHEMTMSEFITLAVQDELPPKLNMMEAKNMGNMRTLAFRVPEELFHKIKDYLQRNNISQKDFVIGLIETEIERDMTQRQAVRETPIDSEKVTEEQTEAQEAAAMSDCESFSNEDEKQYGEQENDSLTDNFDYVDEEYEPIDQDEEIDEEQEEIEEMALSMGM